MKELSTRLVLKGSQLKRFLSNLMRFLLHLRCSNDTSIVGNPECGVDNVEDFVLTRGAFRFTGQTGDSSVTFHVTAVVCLNNRSTSQCEIECAACSSGDGYRRKRRDTVKESLASRFYLNAGPYKFANVEQVQKGK